MNQILTVAFVLNLAIKLKNHLTSLDHSLMDFNSTIAEEGPFAALPKVGHIIRLAEIICEVDGSNELNATALAEAILRHPDFRSCYDHKDTVQSYAVPVNELPWNRPGWCDAEGRCWFCNAYSMGRWNYHTPPNPAENWGLLSTLTHSAPHWTIPRPKPLQNA